MGAPLSPSLSLSVREAGVSELTGRTINSVKIFFGFIVKLLGFLFEFLEAAFGVTVDSILGLFTDIELDFELLRGARQAFLEALETHGGGDE